MQVLIQVTQEDIDKGCRTSTRSCAIARALDRITHDRLGALVGKFIKLEDWYGEVVFRQRIPIVARNFISDFDSGLYVEPFSFQLDMNPDHIRPATNLPHKEPVNLATMLFFMCLAHIEVEGVEEAEFELV